MTDTTNPIHRKPDEGIWISWLGAATKFMALGEETNGTYCLSRATSPAGGRAPPHRHDFEEAFYLLQGSLTFIAGNVVHQLTQGDFINIGANVAHQIRNESGSDAQLLTLCAPSGFDRFQIEGGFPMDGPEGDLVPMSEAVKARILATAEKHGIDMSPPPEAFQESPRATVIRADEGLIIDTVGDRYRFLAMGDDTDGKMAIWHATLAPGGGPPPHTHSREEEGFYVLEGEITFHTDDLSLKAHAGDFIHLPRHGKHWFRNEMSDRARTLILVAPAGLERMFRETGTRVDSISSPPAERPLDEKGRLLEVAKNFGIEIQVPPTH